MPPRATVFPILTQASPRVRREAVRLERDVYSEEYGTIPQPEPGASYFAAINESDRVVASFRILGPEYRPFDFERIQPDSTRVLPHNIGIIGRFCVHKDYRVATSSVMIHQGFLRLALDFATENRLTHLVMYTFPPLIGLYRRARFSEVSSAFYHPGYRQPMTIMLRPIEHSCP